jgi:membrane fusion protein (multidrug efflux system)
MTDTEVTPENLNHSTPPLGAPPPSRGPEFIEDKVQTPKEKQLFKKKKLGPLQKLSLAVVLILGVFGAIHFISHMMAYVETDDAQVAAHSAVLASRINGTALDVLVDENQDVKAGDLLVKIDNRDYTNALDQAAGDLESLFARQKIATLNYKRAKILIRSDSVTQQELDDTQSTYLDLTKKLATQVALVEQAKLNLSYAEIRAPVDGKIGRKSIEKGMYIGAGQSLMTFVESKERWVIANFKETQLRKMRIGQEVEITVDAVGDKIFKGHVDSFAPGSGSAFALIPPDNATGNFTKIVQRVPVKIVFESKSISGFEDRVVPGLSAVVEVKIK